MGRPLRCYCMFITLSFRPDRFSAQVLARHCPILLKQKPPPALTSRRGTPARGRLNPSTTLRPGKTTRCARTCRILEGKSRQVSIVRQEEKAGHPRVIGALRLSNVRLDAQLPELLREPMALRRRDDVVGISSGEKRRWEVAVSEMVRRIPLAGLLIKRDAFGEHLSE